MFEELAIDPSSFAGPSIVRDTERERKREERGFVGFEGIEEEERWNMEGRKVEMLARIILLN